MIKPFTCLCMLGAAGSLMVLYQGKHHAQMLDREIAGLIRSTDQVRERTGLARAEYAMLNDPERLAQLAGQYLQLQSLAPTQFAKLADLPARLPAPVAPVPEPAVMDDEPATPAPVAAAAPPPMPVPMPAAPAIAAAAPARPVSPVQVPPVQVPPVQVATVEPPHPVVPHVAARPPRPIVAATVPVPRTSYAANANAGYAPIVSAFASQPSEQRAPVMQRASAASTMAPSPFVGSALGMARAPLAAPVPYGSATDLGSASGR